MFPLVSIITPVYNAGKMLGDSIQSVLGQSYSNWELLLVNDGSTDNSGEIASSFNDARIHYFSQENKGVSAARNLGLSEVSGDYFCFLDSDDIMPPESLQARLTRFRESPEIAFVDGAVRTYDATLGHVKNQWHPEFNGNPLEDMVCLTGKSFFGPTWMIKKSPGTLYRMREGLSHGEDLLFYMELARAGGVYAYTDEVILHYRDTPGSAMKDLKGLESGYQQIEKEISLWPEISKAALQKYRQRYKKAMFRAYLKHGRIRSALEISNLSLKQGR